MTESEFEGSSGEAGFFWPGAGDTVRPDNATAAKAVGEARPPEFAKDSATIESKVAVSSGEAGSARPGAKSTPVPLMRQSQCLMMKLGLLNRKAECHDEA